MSVYYRTHFHLILEALSQELASQTQQLACHIRPVASHRLRKDHIRCTVHLIRLMQGQASGTLTLRYVSYLIIRTFFY